MRQPQRARVRAALATRAAPRVHLTFDDGPDPLWTPRVAGELERAGTRGTFFVIGERAQEHPEVVRDLVARGHEVELHCMRHVRHVDATRASVADDTREALAVLRRLGVRPRRWRAPGGQVAPWTRALALRHGLRLAGWSADPRDWEGEVAGVLLERVAPQLLPGAVVVMHDAVGPGALRADVGQTVELVELLTANVRARGWRPAPLGNRRPGIDGALARRAMRRARRRREASDPQVEVSCVEEPDLGEEDLMQLGAVLAVSMTRLGDLYRGRPWRRLRPEFRAVARAGGEIVGTLSAFRIGTKPSRRLYGFGDLAVQPAFRGRGIAGLLGVACREEAWSRGAEILLADTTARLEPDMQRGYAPIPRFRFYYVRDGACHWHPNWHALIRHPEPRTRLELEEGDF